MIKIGSTFGIFDIGGGTGICRIYKIIEQDGRRIGILVGSINSSFHGRSFDDNIMQEIERIIVRKYYVDLSDSKIKLFEVAKNIKHALSSSETFE